MFFENIFYFFTNCFYCAVLVGARKRKNPLSPVTYLNNSEFRDKIKKREHYELV